MEGRGAYLRVGLLLIGALAVGIAMVVFLSGPHIKEGRTFESYFSESVQGLEPGSSVRYRGVGLGQVTEIGLVNAVYAHQGMEDAHSSVFNLVLVRYKVDLALVGPNNDLEAAVKAGLRARLASAGLTGQSYVELDFVAPDKYPPLVVPWKPVFDYIPSIPSTFLQVQDAAQQFLSKLNQVNVNALLESLGRLIDDLRVELAAGDVHQTLASANDLLRGLRGAVDGADLPGLSADLRNTLNGIHAVADSKDTKELLANANLAADRLAAAAAKLPPLVATLDQTVHRVDNGFADLQQELTPVLRDARAAMMNLRDTTETLRRYPSQVLLGGPPPRQAGEAGR